MYGREGSYKSVLVAVIGDFIAKLIGAESEAPGAESTAKFNKANILNNKAN
ncbi:hypothetical protein J7E63_05490 [Bacillus sp. ISL-75]|nr:hypothetical protein [Bacillus sp. ISL-75]